jgi:hypothetical protein
MCIIFNQCWMKSEAGSKEEPETRVELGKNSQSRQQKLRQGYIEKSIIPGSDVHSPASIHGPGQARPGQSDGLTMALARPKILESQSRQLRPRLLS